MSSFSLLRSFSSDTQSTPPKRRINKRFSFHQKQHQGVKDPIEANTMERDKKSKANLSRRWSSLKQYQTTTLSQQSLSTGNCSSSMNTSPMNTSGDATPKGDVKKKWEVIEHYRETVGGRETVSSSLLAVSVLERSITRSSHQVSFACRLALRHSILMPNHRSEPHGRHSPVKVAPAWSTIANLRAFPLETQSSITVTTAIQTIIFTSTAQWTVKAISEARIIRATGS